MAATKTTIETTIKATIETTTKKIIEAEVVNKLKVRIFLFLAIVLVTFAISFLCPYFISLMFGGVEASGILKTSFIAGIVSYFLIKLIEFLCSCIKKRNKSPLTPKTQLAWLMVIYFLDLVTPFFFITGFIGISNKLYLFFGFMVAMAVSFSFYMKLEDLPKLPVSDKISKITRFDWLILILSFILSATIVCIYHEQFGF